MRVPDEEIQKMEQAIVRRGMLAENIKILQRHLHKLEKEFPSFCEQPSLSIPAESVSKDVQKPYPTLKGESVRSKSEVIIANELFTANISYEYEKPLYLEGYDSPFLPDFTIRIGDIYEKFGITEWNRTLIVTYETYAGSLNLVDIRQHITQLQRF